MTDWCRHELEMSSCAQCSPRPRNDRGSGPRPDGHRIGPAFSARFAGECDGCGGPIEPGDWIAADGDGGWLCPACLDDARSSGPAVPELW